jgi:hypothetical protein
MAVEVPASLDKEVGPTPAGRLAPRRPDALLVRAPRLSSADGEELGVVCEGRRDNAGEAPTSEGIYAETQRRG